MFCLDVVIWHQGQPYKQSFEFQAAEQLAKAKAYWEQSSNLLLTRETATKTPIKH